MNRWSLSSLSLSSSVWSLLISSLPPAPSTYILLFLSLCLYFCLPPSFSPSTLISQPARVSFMRGKIFFLPTQWTEHEQWQWIGSDFPHRVLLECRLPNQESNSACRKPFLCLWPCASPFFSSLPPPRYPPLLLLCTALIVMLTLRSSVVSTPPTHTYHCPHSLSYLLLKSASQLEFNYTFLY